MTDQIFTELVYVQQRDHIVDERIVRQGDARAMEDDVGRHLQDGPKVVRGRDSRLWPLGDAAGIEPALARAVDEDSGQCQVRRIDDPAKGGASHRTRRPLHNTRHRTPSRIDLLAKLPDDVSIIMKAQMGGTV